MGFVTREALAQARLDYALRVYDQHHRTHAYSPFGNCYRACCQAAREHFERTHTQYLEQQKAAA